MAASRLCWTRSSSTTLSTVTEACSGIFSTLCVTLNCWSPKIFPISSSCWRKPNISILFVSTAPTARRCFSDYFEGGNNFVYIYTFSAMIKQIEQIKKERTRSGNGWPPFGSSRLRSKSSTPPDANHDVVALHISPDLGERILISAEHSILDEVFPETNQAILDARTGAAWNQFDGRQVIRFPLNGYCKLNSIQVLTRLLNAGFNVEASTGGGVESQQFSEYLLIRKSSM